MPSNRYVENDIGRALTADQMAEYREAHDALLAGQDLIRLRWAADIGTLLWAAAVAIWLGWAIAH